MLKRASWPGWLLGIVALKVIMLLVDPQLRLFLGDSASYLLAAHDGKWLPPDRSFVYPWLIAWATAATDWLGELVAWQTLAGIATAMLLGFVLRVWFALPNALVLAAVCLFAIEPSQLFYERMALAETFGLFAFAGFFAAACAYVARPNVLWLPLVTLLGLAAVSLRMNYLPVVSVISLGLPLLLLADRTRRPHWEQFASHILVAAMTFTIVHNTYRDHVAELFNAPPDYIGHAGFMRMGLVAPLIKPEHFVKVGLPADFATHLAYDLADPHTRPAQLWTAGGLADAIDKAGLDVDSTCRKLSAYAIRDDPFGVVRLGIGTLGGYFHPGHPNLRLIKDLGRDPMPYPDTVIASVRDNWHYDLTGVAERWTPVSRAFAAESYWLVLCLFALLPLGIANAIVHWQGPRRLECALAALFGIGLVATHVLFSNIASYRYLHPLPFFVAINALPLACTGYRRRAARKARPPVEPSLSAHGRQAARPRPRPETSRQLRCPERPRRARGTRQAPDRATVVVHFVGDDE